MKNHFLIFIAFAIYITSIKAQTSPENSNIRFKDSILIINELKNNALMYFSFSDKFDDLNMFNKADKQLCLKTPYTFLELQRSGYSTSIWLRHDAVYKVVGVEKLSPILNTNDSIINNELIISDSLEINNFSLKKARELGADFRSGILRKKSEDIYSRKIDYLEKQKSKISLSFYQICKQHFLISYLNKLMFLYNKDHSENVDRLLQYKDSFQCDDLLFSSDYKEFCLKYNKFILSRKMAVSIINLSQEYSSAKANFKGKTLDYLLFCYVRNSILQKSDNKLIESFMNDCNDNEYKQYIKYLLIANKKSLSEKDILFTTNMKTVLLKDIISKYKNKIIYVDFWASWCIPCRKLMSQSHNWKEKYKKDVVFLYISIDQKPQEWIKASITDSLTSDNSFLIQNSSGFLKKNAIKQIPRFMIFDRAGKLFDNNAIRIDDPDFEKKMGDIIAMQASK